MVRSIRAIFDGAVLRPQGQVDLEPDKVYVLTIEAEGEQVIRGKENSYPLTEIAKLAIDMGVNDLSSGHDHYAHGRLEDDGRARP